MWRLKNAPKASVAVDWHNVICCNDVVPSSSINALEKLDLAGYTDRAKAAQVYPVELVEAILRGLRSEMRKRGQINSVEEMLTGASPDDWVDQERENQEVDELFMDDSSGTVLPAELVRKARAEELDWLRKEAVYERVPRKLCEQSEQRKPLQLKWLDVNKGDEENPKVRSRLVTKEIKKAKRPDQQLGAEDTFAATPPVECVMMILSLFMSQKGIKKKRKLAVWDISRAHFMGKAERELFVELPQEDLVHPEDEEAMVGRLLRSMYGTQDASKIFQMDYQGLMEKEKGEFSKLCPALFKFQERGIIGLVHGDDFLVLAEDDQLTWMDGVLNSKYKARWEATVGDGELDGKEMFFLNRLIRYVADGTDGKRLEVEADARHAEILMRSFGFDSKTKGSDIPEDKIRDQDIIVEERSETLDEAQTGEFRSMTMRLAYLSQDRPDVIHASRTLASAMKSPKMGDWLRLKKVVRYLLKYPYMKRTFLEQRPEEVDVLAWSDSDWAGDLRTRRSTTGSVVKIGHHTVLIRAAGQKVVALSSAESEFYGMCRTTTHAEFIRGVINFWGYAVTRVMLKVDSTAARAMSLRKGVGKTRHIQARFLWLQDKVFAKEVAVVKVDGKENEADLVTKVQPATMIKGTQLFGVVRHAERADGVFAIWEGTRWCSSDDGRRFPLDPPLSDAGLDQADGMGRRISSFAEQKGTSFHVVVCSPYARCVQTAVKICKQLGRDELGARSWGDRRGLGPNLERRGWSPFDFQCEQACSEATQL
ncbi:unnamed protein product [Effrenium voratum]|uniref:Reverse transcriptase Ty1/copia-type domain-containing protein n=1 Tax=Effrenium voratum TaxID=2562239 RepID=A0AA36HSA4_9DINO|nr:unnamed protein product [Effrenium voratum]